MGKKIWNVLIADDEPRVCDLIQYLVNWEALGLQVKSVVSNGLEAIEVLENEHIDIVITDARMPECDGLELIKWCHQHQKNLKYIVISGYRHFEYAHGALQYGVDSYLLKPINQTELVNSLMDIVNKIEKENTEIQNDIEVQRQLNRNRDQLRRHFIGSYIFDGSNFCNREIQSMEAINEEYQMRFSDGNYQAILLKIDYMNNQKYQIENLLIWLKDLAETEMESFCNEFIGTTIHSGVLLVVNYDVGLEREFFKKLEYIHKSAEKHVDLFEGLKITIGISVKENTIQGINHCIATAGEAVKYRIYFQEKNIIFYNDYEFQPLNLADIYTSDRRELLKSYIKNGNHNGISKLILDCKFEIRNLKNISPSFIYNYIQAVSMTAMEITYEEIGEQVDDEAIFREFDEQIDLILNENDLWNKLEELLNQCISLIGKEMKKIQTKPIRIVKEYIDIHFAGEISLEKIADEAGLSANYVSALFRKETGITFQDYVISKRMDHAADLLRKTDFSISEISEMCGYEDVKYFSKLCKKTLGIKPSEYRKLYS